MTITTTPTGTSTPIVVTATPTSTPTEVRHRHHHRDNDNSCDSNSNSNDNDGNDNNGNGNDNNDNGNCNGNSNSNDNNSNDNNGNDNNGNGNGNGNDNNSNDNSSNLQAPALAAPFGQANTASACFAPQQTGDVSLTMSGGSATFSSMPNSTFSQETRVILEQVDPSLAPAAPGPRLGSVVFNVRALNGCGGLDLDELPAASNLGVAYNAAADKSRLRIAVLLGGQWVDVPTTADPDPNNPYISATIQSTGTYTGYQAP